MKKLITIALIISAISCNKNDNDPVIDEPELTKPMSTEIYCQHNTKDAMGSIKYSYQQGKLSYEKSTNTIANATTTVEKFYEYNDQSQLINIRQKTVITYSDNSPRQEGQTDFPLEYKNGQLYKETKPWGYYIYSYSGDKIAEKKSYINYNNTLTGRAAFKYEGNRLKEEIYTPEPGINIEKRITTYEYDNMGRVVKIHEKEGEKNSNIIVENAYSGNKLVEKRTYYFGIDPGSDICLGNYLYIFEY